MSTVTIVEAGLLILAMGFGISFANLAYFQGKIKDLQTENLQSKALIQWMSGQLNKHGIKEQPPYTPPFISFDVEGDMTVGGGVTGRDAINRQGG